MKLDVLEKMVLTFVQPEHHNQFHNLFKNFRDKPVQVFGEGFIRLQEVFSGVVPPEAKDADPRQLRSAAAMNGLIIGIFMSKLTEDETACKLLFEDYFEVLKRDSGENVVDFLSARINKRR